MFIVVKGHDFKKKQRGFLGLFSCVVLALSSAFYAALIFLVHYYGVYFVLIENPIKIANYDFGLFGEGWILPVLLNGFVLILLNALLSKALQGGKIV